MFGDAVSRYKFWSALVYLDTACQMTDRLRVSKVPGGIDNCLCLLVSRLKNIEKSIETEDG